MRFEDTLSLEHTLTAIAQLAAKRLTYSQYVSFAGKPLLVRSDSLAILSHTSSFFSAWDGGAVPEHPAAELRLMRREVNHNSAENAPRFRGRGYFALARFTPADSVWFNLRTCRASGFFSDAVVSDESRWHKDILPAVAGILAPTIAVVPVHAACLAKSGSGILLAGRSGVGKSTLAVTLARRGYGFLADDWTYLAKGHRGVGAWSVPVPVKLLPDATRYFPELASYSCAQSLNGELAYEVSPQRCLGLSRQYRCQVRCLVLLERRGQPGISISRVTATEAIDRLCSEIEPLTGPLESAYWAQIELLGGLLDSVCFRASFNASPQEVASRIDDIVADIFSPVRLALSARHGSPAPATYKGAHTLSGYAMTELTQGAHAAPSDATAAARPDVKQHTDMMSRRSALDLNATCQWLGIAVRIDTNSPAILRAAKEWGFRPASCAGSGIDLHMEFVIEDIDDRAKGVFPLRVLRDKQTVFIETGEQGWFAFDTETGNGAGFLAAAESEEAVDAYFRAVAAVIEPLLRRPIDAEDRDD